MLMFVTPLRSCLWARVGLFIKIIGAVLEMSVKISHCEFQLHLEGDAKIIFAVTAYHGEFR